MLAQAWASLRPESRLTLRDEAKPACWKCRLSQESSGELKNLARNSWLSYTSAHAPAHTQDIDTLLV